MFIAYGPIALSIPGIKNKVSANEGISTPEEKRGGNMFTKTGRMGNVEKFLLSPLLNSLQVEVPSFFHFLS